MQQVRLRHRHQMLDFLLGLAGVFEQKFTVSLADF